MKLEILKKWRATPPPPPPPPERESVRVLRECIELQNKKSEDYQSAKSQIRQTDHYPRGIDTIVDIMHGKMCRIYSVLAAMKQGGQVNFESVEDSLKDLCNYSSFAVAYLRGEIDGQDDQHDIFGQRNGTTSNPHLLPACFRGIVKEYSSK